MKAAHGDRLVVRGHRVGDPDRVALVLEARGESGGPPYLVKWLADQQEALYFPGPDARVERRDEAGAD